MTDAWRGVVNICFVSSKHETFDKRVYDKEAVSLSMSGYSVSHLCEGAGSFMSNEGIWVEAIPSSGSMFGRLTSLITLYRRARDLDADAYHCNELDSWLVGVLLRILHRKKCIFDVHEHYPSLLAERFSSHWLRSMAASAVRFYYRLLAPFTDCVVLAKESVGRDFPDARSRVITVKNYAPRPSTDVAETSSDAVPLEGDEEFTVVHLGLFGRSRGWPQVLEALVLLEDSRVKLHVIGKINDGSETEFQTEVDRLGLRDQVRLTKWLPYSEAFSLLQSADVGLIAFQPGIQNHVFAMPHKMFDYMAAGIPVLCPEFAVEVAPVVKECQAGILIDPSESSSIAAAIRKLMDSPEMKREMGGNGKRAVYEKYNWETEFERLVDAYISLGITPGDK